MQPSNINGEALRMTILLRLRNSYTLSQFITILRNLVKNWKLLFFITLLFRFFIEIIILFLIVFLIFLFLFNLIFTYLKFLISIRLILAFIKIKNLAFLLWSKLFSLFLFSLIRII